MENSTVRKVVKPNQICILTLQKEYEKYKNVPGEEARRFRILFLHAIDNYRKGYTEFEYQYGTVKTKVIITPPKSEENV